VYDFRSNSIATPTWHTWTAYFWADFERTYHRQGNKRMAKRLWGCVNAERQHSNTCCNCWYIPQNILLFRQKHCLF